MEESSPVGVAAAATVLPEFSKVPSGPRAPRLTLLRRRGLEPVADQEPEAGSLEAVPDSPAEIVDLTVPLQAVAPLAESAPAADAMPATVAELQAALRRERERADAAESANAVLRRKAAQLDDELATFRPRAIVPFEDTTD